MKKGITIGIIAVTIVSGRIALYSGENSVPALSDSDRSLQAIRVASQDDRTRWSGTASCMLGVGLTPLSNNFHRAAVVLIVSPVGKTDAVPHGNVCRVRQTLKSQGELRLQLDKQVIVEDLPKDAKFESFLMFCQLTGDGTVESLEIEGLSKAAETFVTSLFKLDRNEQLIPFLLEHEANEDEFVSGYALAELTAIPRETFRKHADILPAELILRRALPAAPKNPNSFFLTPRGALYLKLFPFVADLDDFQRLEDLIFRTPQLDNFLRGPFVDPYVALANRKQLKRLSATFVPPTADEQDRIGIEMVYYTYRALREHHTRPIVPDIWYEVSQKLVAANHRMTDIILNDYRNMSDWRFVDEAIRILNEKQTSTTFRRVSVMYLLQAHRDAVRNGNRELAEKAGDCVNSVEEADPKLVRIARKIVDFQTQLSTSKQSP